MVTTALDLRALIALGYEDDAAAWRLVAAGCDHLAKRDWLDRTHLGGSDLGGCVLEKWAGFHEPDFMADFGFQARLARLDLGTLTGLRLGALVATGCLVGQRRGTLDKGLSVRLEPEVTYGAAQGHADVAIYSGDQPLQVVEFKTNYWPRGEAPEDPKIKMEFQVHQVCLYALGLGAPLATICVLAPALTANYDKTTKARVEPQQFAQFDYDPMRYKSAIDADLDRLGAALQDAKPSCDAKEPWRARFCRYAQCECKSQKE